MTCHATTRLRRRWLLGIVVTLPLAGFVGPTTSLAALSPADAATGSDRPYIAAQVPVATGCITLRRGWAGVKVFLVQRRLGTVSDRDRYLGATRRAVVAFQQAQGLDATGRVNRTTFAALLPDRRFCLDRFTVQPQVSADARRAERVDAMLRFARTQVGRRYVWGGAGRLGYDCSGLALQAMHAGGRVLPTVTTYLHQQIDFPTAARIATSGLPRLPLSRLHRGDLVFYGPPGSITHMALYLGHDRVVEAIRPRVRVSSLRHDDVPLKRFVVRPF